MTEPAEFPPPHHITRDLAPRITRREGRTTIALPVVSALLDGSGRLRTGVVAMVADVVSGETAIREALPGWIATSSLSLQVGDLPADGTLTVQPKVVRKGRTTLVLENTLAHRESGSAVGLSTVTFARLPTRNETQARATWAEEPQPETTFATADSGFAKPLLETIGIRFDPEDPGLARADKTEYVGNTLGAMTGGVVAILIDAAADHFAAHVLGGVPRVRSLEIHFLRLAKRGPVRATSRAIGRLGSGILVRVELHDEGSDDTLTSLASVLVERAEA